MFDVFSIKRTGQNLWEVHIENGSKTKTTTVSTNEAVIYLDKATEVMEDLDNKNYKSIQKDFE